MGRRTLGLTASATLFLSACGPSPSPLGIDRVSPSVEMSGFKQTASFDASSPIDALGLTQEGRTLIVSNDRVYENRVDALEMRAQFSSDGDGAPIMSPRSISPRSSGGAWIATDAGLFFLDGLYILRSPLALTDIYRVSDSTTPVTFYVELRDDGTTDFGCFPEVGGCRAGGTW